MHIHNTHKETQINEQFSCFPFNLNSEVHFTCQMLSYILSMQPRQQQKSQQFWTGLLLRCTVPYQDYKIKLFLSMQCNAIQSVFFYCSVGWVFCLYLFVCLIHIYLWNGIKSVNNTCAHSTFKQRLLFVPILSSAFCLVHVIF